MFVCVYLPVHNTCAHARVCVYVCIRYTLELRIIDFVKDVLINKSCDCK